MEEPLAKERCEPGPLHSASTDAWLDEVKRAVRDHHDTEPAPGATTRKRTGILGAPLPSLKSQVVRATDSKNLRFRALYRSGWKAKAVLFGLVCCVAAYAFWFLPTKSSNRGQL
jgi:hypothetical protein